MSEITLNDEQQDFSSEILRNHLTEEIETPHEVFTYSETGESHPRMVPKEEDNLPVYFRHACQVSDPIPEFSRQL